MFHSIKLFFRSHFGKQLFSLGFSLLCVPILLSCVLFMSKICRNTLLLTLLGLLFGWLRWWSCRCGQSPWCGQSPEPAALALSIPGQYVWPYASCFSFSSLFSLSADQRSWTRKSPQIPCNSQSVNVKVLPPQMRSQLLLNPHGYLSALNWLPGICL